MFCKYCGKLNKDDAKFCVLCGKKLEGKEKESLEESLEKVLDEKIEEFGPKRTIEYENYTRIEKERNIYNIDIIKYSKPNYKDITIMCLFFFMLNFFFFRCYFIIRWK